ncbi:RimK/LysX family protein [Botrimarina mediterranea]|uniref:Retropepsin-like aspartic endopeptidase domain-containing protein n=1 Tax=Botrimarina mediterranea TaxID=2528022 RepID=A0A518K485_9BACT|nr:RimK/LysX family protein [Botrimarina mediterranea]QDV72601.1 hypothetical protein Spa11_07810 [Botrimarina mediterranea]QDV77173.1 hypothetical protein K2D_07620 [Planctomycetes bacterium K2D]
MKLRWTPLRGIGLVLLFAAVLTGRSALFSYSAQAAPAVIGETAVVKEVNTGLEFEARVDTGAATSSIHVDPDDVVIVDESPKPTENIDKKIRVRLDNGAGELAWVETKIENYAEVRSANGAEHRYQVRLPLQFGDIQKLAIVNLNDRSSMKYRLLLGRDFLRDDFLVDVASAGPRPL